MGSSRATPSSHTEEPIRVKLMTFRYSATLGGFDDTPLVDFIRDKEVLSFREHFYAVNEVPHLTSEDKGDSAVQQRTDVGRV